MSVHRPVNLGKKGAASVPPVHMSTVMSIFFNVGDRSYPRAGMTDAQTISLARFFDGSMGATPFTATLIVPRSPQLVL